MKNMETKMQCLYQELVRISAGFLIYQERKNIVLVKGLIPQIQEFALWFLKENRSGLEGGTYQDMCQNLLCILNDIVTSLEQEDQVLLQDAIAHGLLEYLELFVGVHQEEEENDTI